MKLLKLTGKFCGSKLQKMSGVGQTASTGLALGLIALLLSPIIMTAIQPANVVGAPVGGDRAPGLAADKRINHVLNRIAFGPRPGDVEAVRRMGIDKYIDLQLHPERISDAA